MKVAVAYVHPNEVSASFHACLLGLIMWDAAHDRHLVHDAGQLAVRCGTDGLVSARNQAIEAALANDVDALLWIDSDMGFAPDSLDALLAALDPIERPVVGGLCFASREVSKDGMAGFRTSPRPTIYQYVEVGDKWRYMSANYYAVNRLIRCDATGSAMILIHRNALKAVKETFGTFYNRLPGADGLLGEDISFCDRLRQLDIPVHVHTGVRTTHHKPQWVGEADWWQNYTAPPATQETAVIVPVLGRPERSAPFMRSLRASTGLATAYAVVEDYYSTDGEAWRNAGAVVIQADRRHFAHKVNVAYRATHEPYLFVTGDDVHFHPGWLDHAQHVAEIEQASLVATNDLGNAAVMAGRHATHPLVQRSYVDEQGASWDGPGVLAHEGYRHWYVDNEWSHVAKQRGVFATALGSFVEHLHPIFGKGAVDSTYRKGQESAEQDERLWLKRWKQHAKAAA